MRTVRAAQTFEAAPADAARRWYDTSRWPSWVEGLDRVVSVGGNWPEIGASVTWDSGPAGRGRVTERVVAREGPHGQTVAVEDDSIRGRQTVTFTASPPGVVVALSLEYELKRRSIVTPVIDALFIRRAMTASLQLTVSRFGAGLRTRRPASP
jgi:hypothetical protein